MTSVCAKLPGDDVAQLYVPHVKFFPLAFWRKSDTSISGHTHT